MVEEAGHGGEVAVPIAKQILQAFASKLQVADIATISVSR
jgi:penicillin-binding protein 2